MVLTPAPQETVTPPAHDHEPADPGDTSAPDLRISMEEFKRLQASGKVIVLDVRDQAMFDRGHIPGARLVPMSGLREAVDSLKTAGVPIVAYCSCPAEETSARAVLYLRKQGVTNVRALTGGYEGWAK
jgi:hydroxyacylglutathione hydrolase